MKKIMISVASLCLLALTVATISSCGAGTLLQTVGSGGTVGNIFTSVIGLDKVSEKGLIGTWRYDSPGVAFTSENLLAKAGGEVAATKIEQELSPYFQQAGLTPQNTSIIFNEDKTFRATIAGKTFGGTWSYDEAQAKVTLQGLLLTVNCYAKQEYGGIALLFESKKLLTVLQTVAMFSGNTTVQKVGELSKNYDGIRLGFDMKK